MQDVVAGAKTVDDGAIGCAEVSAPWCRKVLSASGAAREDRKLYPSVSQVGLRGVVILHNEDGRSGPQCGYWGWGAGFWFLGVHEQGRWQWWAEGLNMRWKWHQCSGG